MKKSRFTRLAAIVLAAATLWITAVTAGADSLRSAIAAVRDSARLPVALLRWELGDTFPVDALALPAMLALFVGICTVGIIIVGYLFNLFQYLLV